MFCMILCVTCCITTVGWNQPSFDIINKKNPKHIRIQEKKNRGTVINNSTDVEEKISKNLDQLHCKIYFMASSKHREFLPLWYEQGFLSKCSQNLVRELSARRPEHTCTCATSSQHRYSKSCPTRNPPCTLVPSLGHLLRSEPWATRAVTEVCWPQDLWKRLARALVQNLPLGRLSLSARLRLRHNVMSLDGDRHLLYCAKQALLPQNRKGGGAGKSESWSCITV